MVNRPADSLPVSVSRTPDSHASSDDGATLGAVLRRARDTRGVTTAEISHITKIPKRHLDALESDDFTVVRSELYQRAEVRAYADAVGLDRDVALAALQRTVGAVAPVAASAAQPRPPVARRGDGIAAAWILVAVAVAVLLMWPADDDVRSQSSRVAEETPAAPVGPRRSDVNVGTSGTAVTGAPAVAARPTANPPAVAVPPPESEQAPVVERAATQGPALMVITEPAGARVTVNGIGWGVTPVSIGYLPPGPKRVRVTHDRFGAKERVVDIPSGRQTRTVHIAFGAGD